MLKAYLDANAVISLFSRDSLSEHVERFLAEREPLLLLSSFAATEFASGIAKLVRMGKFDAPDARAIFANFDAWAARLTQRVEVQPADMKVAEAYLRRLDLTLRAPDALHIAMAERAGATLVTFDGKMAAAARVLGVPAAPD